MAEAFAGLRALVEGQLRAVLAAYPPRLPVDPQARADMPVALLEGAFVLARIGHNRQAVSPMLEPYRNHLELLCNPAASPVGG